MEDPAEALPALETEPDPADLRRLEALLYAFNVEATGIDDGEPFAFLLRDEAGAVSGGAVGWTWGGNCYLNHLVVPARLRGRGLGTRLMGSVEDLARARACGQFVVETHDFQAPAFYRRLGFRIVGAVEGLPRGHRRLTLVKPLD